MADPGEPAGDLVFCMPATVEEIMAFIAELDAEEQVGIEKEGPAESPSTR